MHVKFEGFIEQIYVNYTGALVRKGQPLFKIFSRDLLAAAAGVPLVPGRAGAASRRRRASRSRSSAQQLAAASRERLRLFDVPPAVLADIERTGVAQRAITILSPQTGNVIEKQAIEGLAVTPMMHLYVIADLSQVWVLADVYERDMAAGEGRPARQDDHRRACRAAPSRGRSRSSARRSTSHAHGRRSASSSRTATARCGRACTRR